MFTIRLFGTIRSEVGIATLSMSERTVQEALAEMVRCYPQTDIKELKQSILFINQKAVSGKKRLNIVLKDGDELAILSPVSGG